MTNYRLYIVMFLSLVLCGNANGAKTKHYNNYRKKTTTVQRPENTRYKSFYKQDSLLNVPKENVQITYNEKDIPLEYIIKLDSALYDYQKSCAIKSAPCQDTANIGLLPDSVYIQRLQKIPSIIELSYNDIVRDFISLYTNRRKKLTSLILGQSSYYFPMFEDALDAEGVPFELKYLPVIESALNPHAYSPAGASGLWQFISSTGRTYGLKINSLIDERRDPLKSSRAAARYLKHLYGIYNDWTLVIAAYNCGPGNVNKAIRRANGEKDYWAIYPFLPKETRGYVPAFIAATYAMNYANEHNICPIEIGRCKHTDTVQVTERVHLKQIAAILNINLEELRHLNPQFRTDIVPGNVEPCTLAIPSNKISQYEMFKNTILAYDVPGYTQPREVTVPRTLAAANKAKMQQNIAKIEEHTKQDSTTVTADVSSTDSTKSIANIKNNVATNNNAPKAKTTSKAVASINKPKQQYKVKPGDTLYSIATRNNVSVVNIKKWNSLNSDKLKIGQIILLKDK